MKLRWDKWLYGLGAAVIGGGSSAVVSGVSSMLISPSTFNVSTWDGALKVFSLMGVNFVLSAALSMFFYLKQSPLPSAVPESGDTDFVPKNE